MFNKQKQVNRGFTLAEVLVTLAVIGIVASLTIPSVIKSYEKQQWISGYKSIYSIIKQSTNMIMNDNGGTLFETWEGNTNPSSMYDYYSPYLKIAKKCEDMDPLGNCFASSYRDLNNTQLSSWVTSTYSVVLTNGISLMFYSRTGTSSNDLSSEIYIDINGPKTPNIRGKDLHLIVIKVNPDPVKPFGYDSTPENILSDCPSNLTGGLGRYCGIRILRGDYAED